MIVDDLDVMRILPFPAKADAPMIADPDAVSAASAAAQHLQVIPWRNAQVLQRLRPTQHFQLAQGNWLNVRGQTPGGLTVEQSLRLPRLERPDHTSTVSRMPSSA